MQDFINSRDLLAQVHEQRDELVNNPLLRLKSRDSDVVVVGVPGTFDTDAVFSIKDPARIAIVTRLGESRYRVFTDDNINGLDYSSESAALSEAHANVTVRKLEGNTTFLDNKQLMQDIRQYRHEDAVPEWSDEFINMFNVPNTFDTVMVVLKKDQSKMCAVVRLDESQFRIISDEDINGRDARSLGIALGRATSGMSRGEL